VPMFNENKHAFCGGAFGTRMCPSSYGATMQPELFCIDVPLVR